MKILLFGIAKDIVGSSDLELTRVQKQPTTVAELLQVIKLEYPEFNKLSSLAIAVNGEYASNDLSLQAHDEIAIIPPVSGG